MTERIGLQAVFETSAFSQGLSVYLRGTASAEASTNRAASAINSAGVGISAGFGAAMGTVAVQAIGQFVDSARNAVSEALDLASAFEQLEFGIRALNSSQDLLAGSTEKFSDLFAQNKEEAKGYLLLLQDLAIPSIFTTQQIAQSMQQLQVFGFLADESFELTRLLTQLGSAGNMSSEKMQRIAYAMGQVRTEGRLLATEVRQFSNASIPILEIVGDNLGKSVGEVRGMMKDGLLTADIVFPALIDYLKNFDGVTGESAKTLRGLFSALHDVKEISVSNFMRGLLEPIIPILQKVVGFFTSEDIRAGATALGEVLGPRLAQAIQMGIDGLQTLLTAITSISPETFQMIAVFAGSFVILTGFAALLGVTALAITALVNPFTLVVGALSAFITYYVSVAQRVTESTSAMSVIIGDLSSVFGTGFGNAVNTAISVLSDLETFMGNFIGNVAKWGASVVETFALGINSAIGLVVDAMNTLGEVMSYFLSPGSPPRILPNLDKWGKQAADVYLQGWTEADFSTLDELGNLIETALKLNFGESDRGVPTFKWVAQAKQAVAQAIDEIKNFGQISQDTFASISKVVGSSGDEIFGYLNRFTSLANATKVAEEAQKKLNDVTEAYDKLITPLQKKLDEASEAKQRAGEEGELKGLQRLLGTAGVSDTRKAEASARIQEIIARQQLATLQLQKEEATEKVQIELDAATKAQEAAQKELDLFNQRLQAQNTYNSAIESGIQALERASEKAAKAAKEGITPLEKQLKIIQLQQEEMADLIKEAKARKVLEDENATAAQKMTAQLELQEIVTRRQIRDIEAAKLGTTLDHIRGIQIVAADLEKPSKGKNKLDAIASSFEVLSNADPEGRLAKFRDAVDNFKKSYETMLDSITQGATKINNALPPFLRFMNPPGQENAETPPFWKNFGMILGSVAAFKFGTVTAGLLGLGPAGVVAAGGISLFAAAYIGDWFGMRDKVELAVNFVLEKMKELSETQIYQNIIDRLGKVKKAIDDLLSPDRTLPSEDLMGGGVKPAKSKLSNFLTDLMAQATSPENIEKAKGLLFTGLGKTLNLDMAALFKVANISSRFGGELLIAWIDGTDDAIAGYLKWFIGTALPTMIKGTAKALAGMAITAFKYLFTTEGSAELDQAIMDWWNTVWVEGGGVMGAIKTAGFKIGQGILDGITEFWSQFGVVQAALEFGKWMRDMSSWWAITMGFSDKALRLLGTPIGRGILYGLVASLLPTPQHVWDSFEKFIKGFAENVRLLNAWIEAGKKLATVFISSLVNELILHGSVEVARTLLEMITGISVGADGSVSISGQANTEGQSIGQSISQGIEQGIKSTKGFLPDFGITEALDTVYNAARDYLDAKSPSRKFAEGVGAPIARGIEQGANTINLQSLQTIIEEALRKAIASLSSTLVTTTESVARQIITIHENLRIGIGTILVGMYADQIEWQSSMTTSITGWSNLIYILFTLLYTQISTDTGLFASAIITAYGILQSGVENTVRTTSANVQTLFSDMSTAVATKLDETIQIIQEKLAALLETIRVDFTEKGEDLGKDFAEGIADGILSKIEEISDAAVQVVKTAVTAAEQELQTGSPSKKSDERLGQPFGLGIAQGILKSIDPVMHSVNTLMDSMIGSQPSRINTRGTTNISNARHYHLNVQSQQPSKGVVYDFNVMELMNS